MRYRLASNFTLYGLSLLLSNPQLSVGAEQKSAAMIISGGGVLDKNHSRYENNVRLFDNILKERGFSRDQIQVFFHEGAESSVREPRSSRPSQGNQEQVAQTEDPLRFRPNRIKSLVTGPATLPSIQKGFDQIVQQAEQGRIKRAFVFTTDHGTANRLDYAQSYITLAQNQRLSVGDQERFVQRLASLGTPVALIGTQCFSGHTMEIAVSQPNACAFSAAAPFEVSYAIRGEQIPSDAPISRLSYSTYSFYFSCAQHDRRFQENQAAEDCPPSFSADFNSDGKVSLAEAHFFALSQMLPDSVPQISSHYFAQKILSQKSQPPTLHDLGLFCRHLQDPAQSEQWVQALGDAVAPALKIRISERLALERKVLAQLLEDPKLLKTIRSKAKDTLEVRLEKLKSAHDKFENEYQKIQTLMRPTLKALNDARGKRETLEDQILKNLLESGENPQLKKAHEEMKKSKNLLEKSELPEEKLQIIINRYERDLEIIRKAVDKKLTEAPYLSQIEDLTSAQKRLENEHESHKKKEKKLNEDYGQVRRAYQGLLSYQGTTEIMKSGTPEQKAKMVQLYECEDQIL